MILFPFPYYRNFMNGTPVIPEMYWNTYTYEERIKKLCCEYAKLIDYTDSIADTINEQYNMIQDIDENIADIINQAIDDGKFDDIISDVVQDWIDSRTTGTTYNDLKNHGFLY